MAKALSVSHNMYIISPQSIQSKIIPQSIQIASNDLISGKYPKTIGELMVNGNDLISLGLKGKEIGDAQKMMLLKIMRLSIDTVIPLYLIQSAGEIFDVILPSGD